MLKYVNECNNLSGIKIRILVLKLNGETVIKRIHTQSQFFWKLRSWYLADWRETINEIMNELFWNISAHFHSSKTKHTFTLRRGKEVAQPFRSFCRRLLHPICPSFSLLYKFPILFFSIFKRYGPARAVKKTVERGAATANPGRRIGAVCFCKTLCVRNSGNVLESLCSEESRSFSWCTGFTRL